MMERGQEVEQDHPGFSFQDLAQFLAHSAKSTPFLVFEYPVAMPTFLGCIFFYRYVVPVTSHWESTFLKGVWL